MKLKVRLDWLKIEEERLRTRYQNEEPGGIKERILLEKLLEIIDMVEDVEYELNKKERGLK